MVDTEFEGAGADVNIGIAGRSRREHGLARPRAAALPRPSRLWARLLGVLAAVGLFILSLIHI